jgi:nucleoside-diphosphate-sugar epimerase
VCSAWARSFGISTSSLRYFNVFGPGQPPHSQYAAVVPAFTRALLDGDRPAIFGDGSFSRDFTAVRNAVYANLLAATTDARLRGEPINIGAGARTTVLELFRRIAAIIGRSDAEPRFEPVRSGDVPHSLADLSRARDLLGYEPVQDLASALQDTVEWMRDAGEGDRDAVIFRIA